MSELSQENSDKILKFAKLIYQNRDFLALEDAEKIVDSIFVEAAIKTRQEVLKIFEGLTS